MPNGYLYDKIRAMLEQYRKKNEMARREFIRELARSFRLTKRDISIIMKELEMERLIKTSKKRVVFVTQKKGYFALWRW